MEQHEKDYQAALQRCQLKAVKYSGFASEETHCYEAKLYFDGHHVATVRYDGHGGCDYQDVVAKQQTRWERLEAVLGLIGPYKTGTFGDGRDYALKYDVEHVCGDLMNAWLMDKEIKRVMKKDRIVFLPEGKMNGGFSYFRFNTTDAAAPARLRERIKTEHPQALILTGLPMETLREVWLS